MMDLSSTVEDCQLLLSIVVVGCWLSFWRCALFVVATGYSACLLLVRGAFALMMWMIDDGFGFWRCLLLLRCLASVR